MLTFQAYLSKLLHQIKAKGLSGQLLRGGIGSVLIKITNVLLGMTLAVVLARVLGPNGYGTYAFVIAVVSILSIPAQFGIPRLVVRETAKEQVNMNWGLIRGLWRWATIVIISFSFALVCVCSVIVWFFGDRLNDLQFVTFFLGLILIPLIALGNLRGCALQGLRRVVLGQLPEYILRPGLFILLLIIVIVGHKNDLTAAQAMGLNAVAAAIAFAIGALLLYYSRPEPLRSSPIPVYKTRNWFMITWPLALTAGLFQVNNSTDIIMLGFFLPAEDIGIYRVAAQGAILVVFSQSAIAMFISPYFARFHAQGDFKKLQRIVTIGARAAFFTALPLVLLFALWGHEIIYFMFGRKYVGAYLPLMILGTGQVINTLFGEVVAILNMTGHERKTARGLAVAAVSNIILNLTFIPFLGVNGAALATALTAVIWNFLLWKDVYKILGIQSVAIVKMKHY